MEEGHGRFLCAPTRVGAGPAGGTVAAAVPRGAWGMPRAWPSPGRPPRVGPPTASWPAGVCPDRARRGVWPTMPRGAAAPATPHAPHATRPAGCLALASTRGVMATTVRATTTMRVSFRAREVLRELVQTSGRSMQAVVEQALEQYRREQAGVEPAVEPERRQRRLAATNAA